MSIAVWIHFIQKNFFLILIILHGTLYFIPYMLIIHITLSNIYGALNKYVSDTTLSIFSYIISLASQQLYV